MADAGVRIDSWLWAVRVTKSRSAATSLCKAGHVKVGGDTAKPAQTVHPGTEVTVVTPHGTRVLVVRQLLVKRVSAALAAAAFDDLTPAAPPREERTVYAVRDRGAGRPTKRDRREIQRLRGY
ncbi:RNA-binding S4 domain-containing protein [Homoserinibacter sp. GY 40078]|uniref:RNA-binding S4 domain-containing protein n=1 Tax=Homoserinibacter sp. GY 40078 TaxID=2603275 RepID=UPI0011CBA966|nr:S4 domain-containing protein [Homoserinibacter sp. GY 40078]TXK17745.1 RNA-binding S4 domain-containing protein [Homoserinibacter sp. GY 40078]